jgi:hypothetical protein
MTTFREMDGYVIISPDSEATVYDDILMAPGEIHLVLPDDWRGPTPKVGDTVEVNDKRYTVTYAWSAKTYQLEVLDEGAD